jgi:hypothetical protein
MCTLGQISTFASSIVLYFVLCSLPACSRTILLVYYFKDSAFFGLTILWHICIGSIKISYPNLLYVLHSTTDVKFGRQALEKRMVSHDLELQLSSLWC